MQRLDSNRDAALEQAERLRKLAEAVALMLSSTCFEGKFQARPQKSDKDHGAD
jgi:hypothetical protein